MDTPRRPAHAYFELAAILGPRYLAARPPAAGVRLTVVGQDSVATVWHMDEDTARRIAPTLNKRRLSIVQAAAYDDRQRTR